MLYHCRYNCNLSCNSKSSGLDDLFLSAGKIISVNMVVLKCAQVPSLQKAPALF